jgi:ATP-dependent DNA helicase RecQ
VVKYSRVIDEKPDPREQRIAREQLQQMVHYAESGECRRTSLLRYFGEEYGEANCGACDNCLAPRATYDGTLAAQKFLSCVYRIRERSGFGVGMNHVVEVLTGAETDRIRKWGHEQLSTYGIGTEHRRPEWMAIGRELVRLGYVKQNAEQFNVLELTVEGREVLKLRKPVALTRPVTGPQEPSTPRAGEIACDEVLFEGLRDLRARLAVERGVPPYVIFSDVSLREMARRYPSRESELARVSGMGEKKLREFGAVFCAEIADHLRQHPRQMFADDSFSGSRAGRASDDDALPYDSAKFERLRQVRLRLATRQGVPAFFILHDSALRRIARSCPATEEQLACIKGVGAKKATDFGSAILAALAGDRD